MTEVAHAGEDHGDAGFVSSCNHFASRIEPPGWITAVMPTLAALSRPSRNGKNASEAITEPADLQTSMFCLDRSNTRGVHAAHLARADTDGLTVLGVDDGVGLHVLGDFPGEDQVVDFLFGRCALGHDFQVIGADHADIAALHQQATVDALVVPGSGAIGRPLATGQQAHVGLGGDDGTGFFADATGR